MMQIFFAFFFLWCPSTFANIDNYKISFIRIQNTEILLSMSNIEICLTTA